jgi:hypothetical protein
MSSAVLRTRRFVAQGMAFHARRIPVLRSRLTERFAADLRDLHDALEATELRGHYWVWGGLLLGWARNGAILPHDSLDADFAVADSDFQRLVSAVPAIIKAGFRCDRRFVNNDGYVTEIAFMRHGASFEFFRMFPEAGRLRYFMYGLEPDGAIELEAYMPEQVTVPFCFLGRTWLKHEDHELELRSMYGTWEIPDPSWSYMDGPDIEVRRPSRSFEYEWQGGVADLTDIAATRSGKG